MDKLIALLEEFLVKAIVMTEDILASDVDGDRADAFATNRERLLQIIGKVSNQIDWTSVTDEKKDFVSKQIDYLKQLDEKFIVKLQEYQEEVRKDIERTHRQKENIKGYNLTDVK